MKYPHSLRRELLALLDGGQAHASTDKIISDIPYASIMEKPSDLFHSIWELLEHLRITQNDILEFILRPDYKSKTWPDDYWPDKMITPDENMWNKSIMGFREDLEAIRGLVLAEDADFFTPIPHCKNEKYTLFRQVLLLADHNAHHLGQVICLRRMLNIW